MQTRFDSVLEIITGYVVAFAIAMITTAVVLPKFGFNVSAKQNFGITLIFTIISIIRSYIWRRIFNRITIWRHANAPCNKNIRNNSKGNV